MGTTRLFKETGGYFNALPHELEAMKKDGWSEVDSEPKKPISQKYAQRSKEGLTHGNGKRRN